MIARNFRFAEQEVKTLKEKKKGLRIYIKKRRSEIVNRDAKENRLIEHFYKAVFGKMSGACTRRNVFIYLSFSSEAPTEELIRRLLADGHKVFCPRIEKKEMEAVAYGEDFTLSDYGFREPTGDKYDGEIDVVVLPALAIDEKGNRLGYGGGYYDRFLKKTNALRVGYCYDFQVLKNVPHEEWDEPVDMIVTEERIVYTRKKQFGE